MIVIWALLLSISVKSQSTNFEKMLTGHKATVLCLDAGSEGKYLCSGSYDTDAILWDYNSGQLLEKYSELSAGIWNVKISPDNKYVAVGSWDNNENARGSSRNCLSLLSLESFDLVKSFSIEPDRFKTLGAIPELDGTATNGISKISFNPQADLVPITTKSMFPFEIKLSICLLGLPINIISS